MRMPWLRVDTERWVERRAVNVAIARAGAPDHYLKPGDGIPGVYRFSDVMSSPELVLHAHPEMHGPPISTVQVYGTVLLIPLLPPNAEFVAFHSHAAL